MSRLLASGVQSTGVTVSASVLPMKIQGWFPLEMIDFIPSLFRGFSRVFSSTTVRKHQFLALNLLYGPALTSNITTGKTKALTIWTFVSKVMSLIFNMLSRLVITFLPRSKCLLISWLQSPSAVEMQEIKVSHCFLCFPIYFPWSDGTGCHDLSFLNVEF